MKKISIYILAVMTIGAGCTKTYNDTINGQTPDQRVAAAITAYQKKLTGAPYGWILMESTTGVAYNQGTSQTGPKIVLAYYMSFTDSNKVTMFSDWDPTMAATPKSSSYNVKELTRPALIFDTYSYIHVPCDPDPNISHSPYGFGYGWGTDFEFSFSDSVTADQLGDTIHLTGNLNGARAVLIKATQAQRDGYYAGNVLALMGGALSLNNILEYFKRLSIGGNNYELRLDLTNRTVTFTWVDGSGKIQTQTVNYYITGSGIQFATPIVNGSQTITGISNITYNAGNSTATVTIGSQTGTITGAATPLQADATAGSRWWNYGASNGYFWASAYGFHVNGVDDAYGIRNQTDTAQGGGTYYYLAYWPAYYSNPADRLSSIMLYTNHLGFASYHWAAYPPLYPSNGTTVFQGAGDDGNAPTPSGSAFDKTRQTLFNSAGFYVVQTGEKSYDMVLATNGRTWISWFWPQ
ncbi:MAG: DUF4302 domain-containing protein [Bacteroidetes bacterium]|nr:DUF4302 domain-containing protein [Bacteroidota bacterium]